LLMNGFNPYESARALAGKVVHAHAKDARRAAANRTAQEVPLGHGDIDWLLFVSVLEELDYRGWLVVERESGNNPLADGRAGRGREVPAAVRGLICLGAVLRTARFCEPRLNSDHNHPCR